MFYWITNTKYLKEIAGCFLLLMMLTSCETEKKPISLYPIDSLVTAQINYLSKVSAGLEKEGSVLRTKGVVTYVPKDTVEWVKELDVFRELKVINKPINHENYLVDDNLYDPASNLTVKAFSSKKDDLPVKYLRVFYQKTIRQPRKIEALLESNNVMFKSGRLLSMHFQQVQNKTVLTSYSIEGGQEMMLDDSVAFTIRGRIIID